MVHYSHSADQYSLGLDQYSQGREEDAREEEDNEMNEVIVESREELKVSQEIDGALNNARGKQRRSSRCDERAKHPKPGSPGMARHPSPPGFRSNPKW